MRQSEIKEWCLFLGGGDVEVTRVELHRLVTRLDEAFDIVNYVGRLLKGSPGGFADETLSVSRATVTEAIQHLESARQALGAGDPEAA